MLSSLGKRFGGALLTSVLIMVTLGIGYLIWAAIAYGKGQTPAKQILKMYVIDTETGLPATWGKMFIRNCRHRRSPQQLHIRRLLARQQHLDLHEPGASALDRQDRQDHRRRRTERPLIH